jgi:UDP-3-O-[3-hydroxymyristoyl] glucosamine N-acyltransferase
VYRGAKDITIIDFCSIKNLKAKSITWIKRFYDYDVSNINKSLGLLIVTDKACVDGEILEGYNVIGCDNPKELFFSILTRFFNSMEESRIASTSTIETTKIGKNVLIGNNCYICKDVTIGDNVCIRNNVSIECKTVIGNNSIINSGVIIGTDGFGYYKTEDGTNVKVPHFGGVIIGSDVEIGANTCIDRGTLDDTIIEDNVKIDNLCHIAHNTQIKENSFVIALSMLGGSSVLEKNTYIAPGALVMNQITVGEKSLVGMGAVVTKNVESNKVVVGVPARVIKDNTGGI